MLDRVMVLALVVTIAIVTFSILLVLTVSLVRQTVRLAGAVKEFDQAIRPVLDDIRRDADQAGGRLGRIASRRSPGSR